jgi:hypothetical protein
MRTTIWFSLSAALLFGACTADSDASQSALGHPGDEDECKIEGSDIGRVGAHVITPGGDTITFDSWVPRAGSPGEYIGFTISSTSAHYKVKAATDVYLGYGESWTHPYGDDGHAISNVDFCDEPPEECDYDAGVDHPEDPEDPIPVD